MLPQGSSLRETFLLGVAVAVAVVPEGLAATVTISPAQGAHATAKRGAIVRRAGCGRDLDATTLIATDKTGTLTRNGLRVARLTPAADFDERYLLRVAALASSARAGSRTARWPGSRSTWRSSAPPTSTP